MQEGLDLLSDSLIKVPYVFDAVKAFAVSLHNYLNDTGIFQCEISSKHDCLQSEGSDHTTGTTEDEQTDSEGQFTALPPTSLPPIAPKDMLYYLKNVEFNGSTGRVSFDTYGDVKGGYIVTNLQTSTNHSYNYVHVGKSSALTPRLL